MYGILRQFLDGGELDYLYWDSEVEPKVGPGTDADEDEEGNEGSQEHGVEAEVFPSSLTEVRNFHGEEEYENSPKLTTILKPNPSQMEMTRTNRVRIVTILEHGRYQAYVSVIQIALSVV